MNALEINGLGKTYLAKKGKRVVALSNLNLIIPAGEVFGFLGPNGAGKSTTIKTIMGLVRPTSGGALVAGLPITDPASRQCIGYLPENPSFYDFLTGREFLEFIGASYNIAPQILNQRITEVLERLELTSAADRQIRGYSKGMVQRLGIAQTMIHDPELYILDEPMSGLDPLGRALVKGLIKELKQKGKTVFFSTHITADVEAVCDRVGVIVKGNLRAVDKVETILEKGIEGYNIQLKFNGDADIVPGFEPIILEPGKVEYYVPRALFKRFMDTVVRTDDCEVELVEPVRKDIETFFLEIVDKR